MKVSKEIMEKAQELENESLDYMVFGIRVQDEPFEMGEMSHRSHVWDDGEETDEELDGVCASLIRDAQRNYYYGDHVALIAGNRYEYGEDIGEVIIIDPVVVGIYC